MIGPDKLRLVPGLTVLLMATHLVGLATSAPRDEYELKGPSC